MTLDTLIMLSGAFVAVLPFLGFPNNWDSVFFFFAGVIVISLGIALRRRDGRAAKTRLDEPHFVETTPHSEEIV